MAARPRPDRPITGIARPDLRRRPRRELRPVRGRPRRPGHRPQRLRRDGRRPLGVGPQAPRRLAGARRAGRRARTRTPAARRRTTRRAPTGAPCGCWPSCRCWTPGTPSPTRSSSPTPTPATCSARWSGCRRRRGPTPARGSRREVHRGDEDGGAALHRGAAGAAPGPGRGGRGRGRRRWSGYLRTLAEDRLPLLARYAVHDVAFRVVGTGSVGTRSYVVLLLDHLRRAAGPAGEGGPRRRRCCRTSPGRLHVPEVRARGPPGGARPEAHAGGQRHPAGLDDGRRRPFQVRQFRNRKGSVDPAALPPTSSTTTAG